MGKVQVVTDSSAYLRAGTVRHLGVTVVPLIISFGEEELRHGIDITTNVFSQRFKYGSTPPIISPPSVSSLRGIYTKLSKTTDETISIHASSELSSFCQAAASAAAPLLGRCRIEVVDSLATSLGLGILVTTAAKAAEQGRSLDEIVHLVRGMIPHMYGAFVTESLVYLEKDGLIDKTQAVLGTMLDIKPFLVIEDGKIMPMEKVQTREEALDKLFNFVAEFSHIEQIAVVQSVSYTTKEAGTLIGQLKTILPDMDFPVILCDPILASHIGPDAIGVIVYEGMDRWG